MPSSGRAPSWVSYSDVADAYERYHVQRGYALLAHDLVLALELLNGAIVLDVGTGTGAAALIALHRSPRTVIGLDPSLPMLGIAAKKGLKLTVAGEAPTNIHDQVASRAMRPKTLSRKFDLLAIGNNDAIHATHATR